MLPWRTRTITVAAAFVACVPVAFGATSEVERLRAENQQLRQQLASTQYTVATALTMVMTPGGHGQLGPKGWLYAESGTTQAGSAAFYVRTGLRGWRVRVWEDGSTSVSWRGRRVLTACLIGKGCED